MSPIEFKWAQVGLSESHWVESNQDQVRVSTGEIKSVLLSPSEIEWVQLISSETTGNQMNATEVKWVQEGQKVSKGDHVRPSEIKRDHN